LDENSRLGYFLPLLDKEEVLNSPLLDEEGWGAVD